MSRFYVCSYQKKCCFQILEIIFWKENDFYKQGFLKNVYNKNQRKKTNYFDELRTHTHTHTYIHIHTYIHTNKHTNIHTYIHTYIQTDRQTERQTDIHTYIHNFYHLLNSGGVKNRFCDSCNAGITMKASLGFIAIFAVNIYIYTAFRT